YTYIRVAPYVSRGKRAKRRAKAASRLVLSRVVDDVAGHLLQARFSVLGVPTSRPTSLAASLSQTQSPLSGSCNRSRPIINHSTRWCLPCPSSMPSLLISIISVSRNSTGLR
ncbi:unnamed protein product, partial [Ectocarpus sp. 4 AP-2014]